MQVKKILALILIAINGNAHANSHVLNFDYLKCGDYQFKGKIIKSLDKGKKSYLLNIFPDDGSRRYKKSRTINLKLQNINQLDSLEAITGFNVTLQGAYHKDSHVNNYITFHKVIGPISWTELYEPLKVIKKIKSNICK